MVYIAEAHHQKLQEYLDNTRIQDISSHDSDIIKQSTHIQKRMIQESQSIFESLLLNISMANPPNKWVWHIIVDSYFSQIWARFLSLALSKLTLCSANHWPIIAWAYSEQETENRPWLQREHFPLQYWSNTLLQVRYGMLFQKSEFH